jgi:hypothetical protein
LFDNQTRKETNFGDPLNVNRLLERLGQQSVHH